MDAQWNATPSVLNSEERPLRSRALAKIDPAWPGVRGLRDLWRGWRDYRELWITVGLYDIRKRYRRSLLGPFWITISLGAFIFGLSFIYVPLVGGDMRSFLPFVAFGFIAWQLISQLLIEGCNVFIANGSVIQQFRAPLSMYIYQTVWRNLLILAHNLLIYAVVAIGYGLWPTWQTLLVIPGVVLVCINGMSFGLLLGTLSARFRDIPPIVATVTQMMFLLTPILWRPEQVPGREWIYLFNPFYYLVQIIREPLEGISPSPFIWGVALAMTSAGFIVSLLFFSRFRNRIVYWL
jgi:ABC-2 type transport system permease protein/lipopolysaccharide transport system permease protein